MTDSGTQRPLLRVASPRACNTQQPAHPAQQPAQQPATLPSLKALAVAVLARNKPRNNDATGPEKPRNNDPGSEVDLLRDRLRRLAEADGIPAGVVERRAGLLDEYQGADDATLTACLRAWALERPGNCAGCGQVWLPAHWSVSVLSCPWCAYRRAGQPFPRPRTDPRVTCEACRHRIPDPVNPADGWGRCAAGGPATWPRALHLCERFEPTTGA